MPNGQELSVVTLNTWKGEGEYRVRLRLIAEGLAALDPDIVLLQECFAVKDGDANTARHLAETLGLNGFFQPAREKLRTFEGENAVTQSGLAVLSRYPLEPIGAVELPADPADGQRVAQFVSVKTGGAPVLTVNTHLTHLPEAHDLRVQEMQTIVKRIREDREHETVLLGGDFNATPDMPVIRWLRGLRNLKAVDAGAVGSPNGPGATKLEKEGEMKDEALKRVDYLFLITRAAAPRFEVAASDVVLDTPDPLTGLFPSDHLGVRVAFRPLS